MASRLALLLAATTAHGLQVMPDGRRAHVFKTDSDVSTYIKNRVVELATAAIDEKGAFSMSIGSGTTVKPLTELGGKINWQRVHVFFGNERTEGDAAGKCCEGAAEFISATGIPAENVYAVPKMDAESAAQHYETILRAAPSEVVGVCAERGGLPVLDLVLLGSGADGHCASLYPESSQVEISPGSDRAYVAAEGKGGITLTIDAIGSARNVLVSAGKAAQADMVRKSLTWSGAVSNHKWPAGMIAARAGATDVEWLLTEASAAELPAL